LETSTIASLVKYFNIASIIIISLFAAFGAYTIYRRITRRVSVFGGKKYILLSAFCLAALAAFILEVTAFNFQHYMKLFAGPEIETVGVSPENPNIVLTTGGTLSAEFVVENSDKANADCGLLFRNLNLKVTSIYTQLHMINDAETVEMSVLWTDEAGTHNFKKNIRKRFPHDNHTSLQPSGKISELKIMFSLSDSENNQAQVDLEKVTLNKTIPFHFSGLRIIVAWFLFFAIICLLKKEPRDRAAYYLFDYKGNSL